MRRIVNARFVSWCRVKTVSSVRLTYHPHPPLTQEEARDLRATTLRYVLDRYFEKQEAAETSGEKGSRELQTSGRPDEDRSQ